MKDKSRDIVMKMYAAAAAVTILALFWLKPVVIPEMILLELAVWLAVSKFARPGGEKRRVEVDIKI